MKKVRVKLGKIKIKIKGKKPFYIDFPPLDRERGRSVKVLFKICKKLFEEVEILNLTLTDYTKFVEKYSSFVLKTNPFLYQTIQKLKSYGVNDFEIEKSAIVASSPKLEIKKRYGVKDDFALVFIYGGNTLFHTRILVEGKDEEKILEEYEKIRKLNKEILDIYGEFYDKSYEEVEKYIQQKFFITTSKPIKDFTDLKYFFEVVEQEKLKPKIEEIIERKVEEKSYEKSLEVIEKEIHEFLSKDFRELKNFTDKALYMRLKQIDFKNLKEDERKKVYQLVDKYFSSERTPKDLEDLMQSLNIIFFKIAKLY
jgi:hypothetical protein